MDFYILIRKRLYRKHLGISRLNLLQKNLTGALLQYKIIYKGIKYFISPVLHFGSCTRELIIRTKMSDTWIAFSKIGTNHIYLIVTKKDATIVDIHGKIQNYNN